MKNHTNKGQSTSIILEDDAGFNQFNDTLSLEDDPFFAKGPTEQKGDKRVGKFVSDMWNMGHQNKNDMVQFENNFNQQLLISNEINQPNKDFAGETFSQISSTFEQQAMYQLQSQPSQPKMEYKVEKSPQNNIILTSKNEYKNVNNDDLLDFECLNKSSQNSPSNKEHEPKMFQQKQARTKTKSNKPNIIQNQSQSFIANSGLFDEASIMKLLDKTLSQDVNEDPKETQKKNETLENMKDECGDVVDMLTKISQSMKAHYKSNRAGSGQSQKVHITIGIDEIKQIEILSTSAIQKVREIQALGESLSKQTQVKNQKDYIDQVRERMKKQIQKQKTMQKKQVKRMEDEKFKFAINEFELNQRVSQLEDAFNRQQDEINKQANKNEMLQREKQVLSKKYEKRMNEIEGNLKSIIHSYISVDKMKSKVNNSFCLGKQQESLLIPLAQYPKSKKMSRVDSQKENEKSFVTSDMVKESRHNTDKKAPKSLQAQLINLKKMIKAFKKVDTQQPQDTGHYNLDQNGTLKNFLSQLINLQNESIAQHSMQYIKPEDSQASINQAFIESNGKSDQSNSNTNNNTSFFGKDMFNQKEDLSKLKENMSSLISLLISARTGNNNQGSNQNLIQPMSSGSQDGEIQQMFYDRFKDLSMTQQEKLLEEIWASRKQYDEEDKRDVDLNDILEISKKTINSVESSILRTGRPQSQQQLQKKRDSDQLSILRVLQGASSANQLPSGMDKKDKNNSTLEISFNQNEIQVVDGLYQKLLKDDENDMRDLLKLDDKISARDILDKAMLERSKKQALTNQREQILQNNRFFGSSLDSELQMDDGKASSRCQDQQNNSVEEDLHILNNIGTKQSHKNDQNMDFPDFSMIEANNSLNLQTAGRQGNNLLMMTGGSIQKDGNDSLYSKNSDLMLINHAFQPPKQPMPVMTIKVQDRVITIPKLDLKRAELLNGPQEKFDGNLPKHTGVLSESSSSMTQNEISSFQNESVQKPFQVTDNFDKSNYNATSSNEKNMMDKAIIVEEEESDVSIKHEEGDFFGSFKKQLDGHQNKDDTLDLEMDNDMVGTHSKKSVSGKFAEFFKNNKQEVKHTQQKSKEQVSVAKSQSTSFLKKSQSENQLANNQDLLLDEKLLNQQNYDEQSSGQPAHIEKKKAPFTKVGFDFKKIKTPTSAMPALKFNFGAHNVAGGLKIIKQISANNQAKARSSSSDIKAKLESHPSQPSQPENNIFVQNCDEDDEISPDAKEVNKSKLIKASLIKLSKVQKSSNITKLKSKVNQSHIQQPMNDITCAQDQSVIASSFFQDNNYSSIQRIVHKHDEDSIAQVVNKPKGISISKLIKKKIHEEDSLLIQPKDNNMSLLQNYFSASESANTNQAMSLKLRPSSGGKKILKISNNSSINMRNREDIQEQPYRASSNSILRISKVNITSSCEFDISDDVNASRGVNETFQQSPDQPARISKSNTPKKQRISVLRKTVISKVNDQGEQKISLNRISLQKRRTSENNQSEIMHDPRGNQSVIHQQPFLEPNMSYIIPQHDQSVLKGIDDTSIMINNKSVNLRQSHERKQIQANMIVRHQQVVQEEVKVQQPKIISNIKINNVNQSQINSQKSINKISKINQIINLQQQQTEQVVKVKTSQEGIKKESKQKVLYNENLHIKKERKVTTKGEEGKTQQRIGSAKRKTEGSLSRPKSKKNSNNQTLSSSASMRDL